MSPADLSTALLRAPPSPSPSPSPPGRGSQDGYAPALYGLLAALLSAAVTALLLGGAP